MAVDQIAGLLDGVAVLRDQIQVVAGQLLPVETHAGDGGQPVQHVRPGLPAEVEPHLAAGVRADLQLRRVRLRGRRRRPLDRARLFVFLLVFLLFLFFLFLFVRFAFSLFLLFGFAAQHLRSHAGRKRSIEFHDFGRPAVRLNHDLSAEWVSSGNLRVGGDTQAQRKPAEYDRKQPSEGAKYHKPVVLSAPCKVAAFSRRRSFLLSHASAKSQQFVTCRLQASMIRPPIIAIGAGSSLPVATAIDAGDGNRLMAEEPAGQRPPFAVAFAATGLRCLPRSGGVHDETNVLVRQTVERPPPARKQ